MRRGPRWDNNIKNDPCDVATESGLLIPQTQRLWAMSAQTRSWQRPDTLMQDRIKVDETSCTARPDHTFGSFAPFDFRRESVVAPKAAASAMTRGASSGQKQVVESEAAVAALPHAMTCNIAAQRPGMTRSNRDQDALTIKALLRLAAANPSTGIPRLLASS
jgi:hypothetical protein